MTEFFLTAMGRRFYGVTMPQLVEQLRRLNDNLEARMVLEDARSAAAKEVLDAQLAEAERYLAAMKKEQEEKLAKEWAAIPVEDPHRPAYNWTRCPKCKEVFGWNNEDWLEGQECGCCSYTFNEKTDINHDSCLFCGQPEERK